MTTDIIIKLIYAICGAILALIPCLCKIVNSIKKLKNAKCEEDKLNAINDMREQMEIFIQAAEIAYKDVNASLKAKGSSAGPIKKDSVLIKLQSYANEKNYNFDVEFWSNAIDKFVASTRNVNAN